MMLQTDDSAVHATSSNCDDAAKKKSKRKRKKKIQRLRLSMQINPLEFIFSKSKNVVITLHAGNQACSSILLSC